MAAVDLRTTELTSRVRAALDAAWTGRYAVPSPATYPSQFLWDSCFHAVVWAALGDDRAAVELGSVFRFQSPAGFVPHVAYDADPGVLAGFWGREGCSSLTQPPMYGHACAELARRGFDVPAEVVERSAAGLRFLLDRRARVDGLVAACHPWETGADHSPRWDDWCPGGFDPARWYDRKGELLASVERSAAGDPLANPAFVVAPAGFNALVAFNAMELGELAGDDRLAAGGAEVAGAVEEQWDEEAVTWRDAGPRSSGSGRVRVLDGLLPALVSRRPDRVAAALAAALDDRRYGGACGPAGVHRDEPAFAARTYWRGPAWPPLTYLLWLAARRAGDGDAAGRLAAMAGSGAVASGLAEYWDADDGTGLGAVPQSWAGLAVAMAG
jgi:hypothetical protein